MSSATPDPSDTPDTPAEVIERYPDPPVSADRFPLGRRRLRDIPRALQRPLECQLRSLQRIPGKTTMEISSRLDLHPDDLEALGRTGGMI